MEVKIIKVDPRELRLLEVNARYMKESEYRQLVENVKNDGALTSVPFVYPCDDDWDVLEVLSGNHRVQAAIEAGLKEIDAMTTDEELTKDQKIGIQLSHNTISGQDDLEILKKIYEQIDDVKYKQYSGLDDETLELMRKASSQSMSSIGLDYQLLNIVILPTELEEAMKVFKRAKEEIKGNAALTMRFSEYDKWLDTIDDVGSALGIKNTATTLLAMLGVVENHMDELSDWKESAEDKQWIPLSAVFGRSKVKASDGRLIDKVVQKNGSKRRNKKSKQRASVGEVGSNVFGWAKKIKEYLNFFCQNYLQSHCFML